MSYYGADTKTVRISIGSEYVTVATHSRSYDTTSLARILRRETNATGNEVIVLDRYLGADTDPLHDDADRLWWQVGEFATELHSQQPAKAGE